MFRIRHSLLVYLKRHISKEELVVKKKKKTFKYVCPHAQAVYIDINYILSRDGAILHQKYNSHRAQTEGHEFMS